MKRNYLEMLVADSRETSYRNYPTMKPDGKTKEIQSEELQSDVDKFLENGGCIKDIPMGETSDPFNLKRTNPGALSQKKTDKKKKLVTYRANHYRKHKKKLPRY